MATMTRKDYAAMYGPTKGDAVRLGDTSLLAEVEHDFNNPGDECLHGGGKTLRTMAGSGGVIVMDDHTDIVSAAWRILHFFAEESCGQCTPCREGTGWLTSVVARITQAHGRPGDVDLAASIADGIAGNTICALGDAAAWPTLAFLTKYRGEFEAKIKRSSSDQARPKREDRAS